jgi:hypothetical protein
MTHVEQLYAASAALRAHNDPYDTAVANWLNDQAQHIVDDTANWPRGRIESLDTFIKTFYRHPLAVADAVLDAAPSKAAEHL